MAAASRFDRSVLSFVSSFSAGATFSSVNGFSIATGFSAGAAFAFDDGFSLFDDFALADDLSVVGALAAVDGLSVVDVFGFVVEVPFDAVEFFVDAAFGAEDFSFAADAVAVSATDLGAVSGFTAGAHALAMTIAISGIRA